MYQSPDERIRRYDMAQAKDAAWELVDRLTIIGASKDRELVVKIAKRLTSEVRSLDALNHE
jgi:hypothetical protein